MDNDNKQRAKSLKTLADNERWLHEHPAQTIHAGDLPTDELPSEPDEIGVQQQ